tara:strand:+ start:5192 stop:5485 length:294 start_codon:yes stop_codon:yes gene_type:complete
MNELTSLEFWQNQCDVFIWQIGEYNYLSAIEVSLVLNENDMCLSDNIYHCDITKLMFTEVKDFETKIQIEYTVTLFIPLELLSNYINPINGSKIDLQ